MKMQNEMVDRLAGAIPLRGSVRVYTGEPVPEEKLSDIREFIDGLAVPFEHNTRFDIFTAELGRKLYNNGINPPTNIAMLSQTDLVSVSKTGFVGELLLLHATSLELSTCWFGHYKLSEVGRYVPGIATEERIKESNLGYGYGKVVDVGERVICGTPVGYRDGEKKRLLDIVAGKISANRKPIEALLENPELAPNIPDDIASALDLARLAPSAGNMQMWRFGLKDDFKTVTVAKPVGYKHFKWEHPDVDIGICAAHLWLGLLQKGYEPSVDVAMDEDRALWSFGV
ncbi:MAG: hypothetical protein FWH32_03630 [Clostridiales bacterium]|nr:hypothetical protein [Clostridiales bacterium]